MSIDAIRHLVVLSHPMRDSFNHQIAKTYCETARECGQIVMLRDLYAIRFDPVLEYVGQLPDLQMLDDVAAIQTCDVLTFIYPIWFGLPPAMIKGYVDRVLGAGFQPRPDQPRADSPFLAGKRMLNISTSASSAVWMAEQGQLSALRDGFDHYLATIFGLASAEHIHIDSVMPNMSSGYAEEQLERVREATRAMCADALNVAHRKEAADVKTRQQLHLRGREEKADAGLFRP